MQVTKILLWLLLLALVAISIFGLVVITSASKSASTKIYLDASFHAGSFHAETSDLQNAFTAFKHALANDHEMDYGKLLKAFDAVYARHLTLTQGEIHRYLLPETNKSIPIDKIKQLIKALDVKLDFSPLQVEELEPIKEILQQLYLHSRTLNLEVSRFSQRTTDNIAKQIKIYSHYALYSFVGTLISGLVLFLIIYSELRNRLKVTRSLAKAETDYRTLFETSNLPIFTVNNSGIITDANNAFRNFFKMPQSNFLGTRIMDIGTPYDSDSYKSEMRRVISDEIASASFHWIVPSYEGTDTFWDITCTGIYSDERDYQGAISVCRDITERVNARSALEESYDRNRSFNQAFYSLITDESIFTEKHRRAYTSIAEVSAKTLNLSHCSLWVALEESDLFTEFSPVFAESTISRGQLLNRFPGLKTERAVEILGEDIFDPILQKISAKNKGSILIVAIQAEGGMVGIIAGVKDCVDKNWNLEEHNFLIAASAFAAIVIESNVRRKSQAELEVHKHNLEDLVGLRTQELTQSNLKLQTALDDLKKTGEQLLRAEKMASLGSLVAGIAHEINTPLGNSITVASTLEEKSNNFKSEISSDTLRRSSLDAFLNDVKTAAALLTRNLFEAGRMVASFKRVSADQTSAVRRKFECESFTKEILITLGPSLKNTGINYKIDIPHDIILDSYPGEFSQVITNLVLNSVLHAFDEGQSGIISIDGKQDNDIFVLIFSDNGCGATEQQQKMMFDPFYTTKLGQGGSGLGLSIVYSIITGVLGGDIKLDSTPGKGTKFTINLPVKAPVTEKYDEKTKVRV